MDATPYLEEIARKLAEVRLEAVMIGNAAAALQGAPVTTVDIDFLFRKTRTNVAKIRQFAKALGMMVRNPFYPAADMLRLERDTDQLQIDFCVSIAGIRSFEGVRKRSSELSFGGHSILVADLNDVIRSKRAAGRPKDLAILDTLTDTYAEIQARRQAEKET